MSDSLPLSPATPGPKGSVPADPSWTPSEVWVWDKLQAGDIADLDHYHDEEGQLPPADPKMPEEWQDGRRRLSARFLEAILLEERFRGALHRKGVRIDAAWFDHEMDLEMAEVTCVLWLDRCRFERRLRLARLETAGDVTFDGSAFVDRLDLQGAHIKGNLFFRRTAAFDSFVVRTAKIDGLVDFTGAKITGALDMNGASVGQGLLMISASSGARAEFGEVNLIGAKVGGQVNLSNAVVKGTLAIGGATLDHDLLMSSDRSVSQCQAEFDDVSLRSIRIRGQLALVGVNVNGALDIGRAEIGQDLLMCTDPTVSEHRATYKDVDLRGAKVHGQVNLTAAQIRGQLIMNSAVVEQSLLMSSRLDIRAEFNSVNLQGAVIGGVMTLAGAKVAETLDMSSSDIGQTLDMSSADRVSAYPTELNGVLLRGAKIGGQLTLSGAKVAGELDMDAVRAGNGVFLNYDPEVSQARPEFHYVDLSRARIDGVLGLRGATVKGMLVAESARINGTVFLEGCKIPGEARFLAAAIEGDVLLGGATIGQLDLHGAHIRGELSLARPTPGWRRKDGMKSRLNLRNASCDTVQDGGQLGVWPEEVELDGFAYSRFGGLGADPESDVAKRGSKWFMAWLTKDKRYTPQPYHQCAKVLREMGHPEMANDILYEGRERERHEIWAPWPGERGRGPRARFGRSLHWLRTMLAGRHPFPWYEEIRRSLRWFGLLLLAFVVGYGYGSRLLWRPLLCAVLTIAIGVRVTYSDASAFADSSFWWRTLFSLDMLLPIVELSREHTLVQAGLDGLAYGWFVVQRLFGWVLALFLIAGLTGLTK